MNAAKWRDEEKYKKGSEKMCPQVTLRFSGKKILYSQKENSVSQTEMPVV